MSKSEKMHRSKLSLDLDAAQGFLSSNVEYYKLMQKEKQLSAQRLSNLKEPDEFKAVTKSHQVLFSNAKSHLNDGR